MSENTNIEREALLNLIDAYAKARAMHALEDLYGTSQSYTAELLEKQNAARAKVVASLSLPAAGQEPYCWTVSGGHSMFRGKYAKQDALSEAKQCGGMANALPLYAAPQPAAAAGWVMVPADPTLDMGWAYLDAARESEPFKTHSFNHDGYRAMLKAAPLPPAPSTEGERDANA